MKCKAVILKSGITLRNVDINKSQFEDYIEVWENKHTRKLINKDEIMYIYPDDAQEVKNGDTVQVF